MRRRLKDPSSKRQPDHSPAGGKRDAIHAVSLGEASQKISIRMPGMALMVTQGDLVVQLGYEVHEKSAAS